jgi:hypothetical protein
MFSLEGIRTSQQWKPKLVHGQAQRIMPSMSESTPSVRTYDSPKFVEFREKYSELSKKHTPDPHISSVIDFMRGTDPEKKPFEALQQICDRHLARSGVSEIRRISDLLFLQLSNEDYATLPLEWISESEMASVSAGMICVNDGNVMKGLQHTNFPRLYLLHNLVHEIGHSLGDKRSERYVSDPRKTRTRDGVSQVVKEPVSPLGSEFEVFRTSHFFYFLNEAINDDWTEHVVREYALATGFATSGEINTFYAEYRSLRYRSGRERYYAATNRFIDVLVQKVAQEAGIDDPKKVRSALWRAGLEGLDFFTGADEESEFSMLDEAIKPGFTDALSKMTGSQSLDKILRKYKLERFFKQLAVRLQRRGWL